MLRNLANFYRILVLFYNLEDASDLRIILLLQLIYYD